MSDKFDFTTANKTQLEKAWKAIANEMGDDRFFTSRELNSLPGLLAPMEQVLAFSSGLHEGNTWLIVLTDQRIILLDKGMFYGLRQSTIELNRVNSIESKVGIMFGEISIGSNAKNYLITNVWKKTVNPFTSKVREAQAAYDRGISMHTPAYPPIKNFESNENHPKYEMQADKASEVFEEQTFQEEKKSTIIFREEPVEQLVEQAKSDHQIRMENAGLNWRKTR